MQGHTNDTNSGNGYSLPWLRRSCVTCIYSVFFKAMRSKFMSTPRQYRSTACWSIYQCAVVCGAHQSATLKQEGGTIIIHQITILHAPVITTRNPKGANLVPSIFHACPTPRIDQYIRTRRCRFTLGRPHDGYHDDREWQTSLAPSSYGMPHQPFILESCQQRD
jgi:hypothetical protein